MCRLYVSLKTCNNERILTKGYNSMTEAIDYYNSIINCFNLGKVPNVNFKFEKYHNSVLAIYVRKNKRVRSAITIKLRRRLI